MPQGTEISASCGIAYKERIMPYTSFNPNNERFGFDMRGGFRHSHGGERPFIIIGAMVIIALMVVFFSSWVGLNDYMGSNVNISTYIAEPLEYGVQALAMAITLYATLFLLAVYIIIICVMKAGVNYSFHATETYFDVWTKNKRHVIINYDDVINVMHSERRFPLAAAGLDITIVTKKGTFEFMLIHTPKSKTGGISETPFNIVLERAGLVAPPDMFIGR